MKLDVQAHDGFRDEEEECGMDVRRSLGGGVEVDFVVGWVAQGEERRELDGGFAGCREKKDKRGGKKIKDFFP